MKKITIVTIMAIITSFAYALPVEWNFFSYDIKEDKTPVTVPLTDNKLIMPDGKKIYAKKIKSTNNCFDFEKLAKPHNHAVLSGSFNCEKARKTYLGIGGLAFAVELNGKMIYDFRRRGLGNDYNPVSVNDHIIPVTLKKGENKIVIRSCRTNWLLDYCYGAERKIDWNFVIAELKDYKPVKPALAHPELLLRPAETEITVSFITETPVHAGVDYRVKGTSKWLRQWDLADEVVLRDTEKNHIVRLENLKADTIYEYRIVLLEPPLGGEKRSLWQKREHKEIFTPVKTFKTLGSRELNFFTFADTQLSISGTLRTVADREKYMQKMRNLPEFKKSDFIVINGDLTSYFHDVEKDLFTYFFDSFGVQKDTKPWVYVRGNHELDGLAASVWHKYFVPEGKKSYYSFKNGDTLFIVLACGDTVKGKLNAHIGPIIDTASMISKQRQWLESLVESDDFKNAKFRIVLSHISPQINEGPMTSDLHKIAVPLLKQNIHLWIGAHCHRYWRMFKNSNILHSVETHTPKFFYEKAKCNWLTLDGPKGNQNPPDLSYLHVKISGDKLFAKVIDPDGKLIDSFTISPDGTAAELKHADNLKQFKLQKK
ncbi:MAG: metallophosphoesterase [Lentisphaeria bacterium]|nr:metallophosphoesterase [Lentisphaeria bacterium]